MPWTLALMFTIGGLLGLAGIISPNGVRRATGRLAPEGSRRPDLTPRQVLGARICSAGILVGIALYVLFYL